MHSDLHGAGRFAPASQPSASAAAIWIGDRFRRVAPKGPSFRNPIVPSPSADPWVIQHEGQYFSCESRQQDSIWIRRSSSLTQLAQDSGKQVWSAPALGPNSKSLWAPELHRIDGRWYIYYAADNGLNENHRMWVLEGLTSDPAGPYRCRGAIETAGWAIDGTILPHKGKNFFVWSGWPGRVNGQQNLYAAEMRNPWTLGTPRALVAEPTLAWECVDMAICEGPQILQRNGRTFLIYSASGSWTVDYCLGLLELTGSDPLHASHWTKRGCVFSKTDSVWGVGHCSFVQSPDGKEDWIVYHAKTKRKKGWNDRNVRAQQFGWTADGLPHFGRPVPAGMALSLPSGDPLLALGI
jgi:GH43 family beta-xylosidase